MARPKKETIQGPILDIGKRVQHIVRRYFDGVEAELASATGRAPSTINGYTTQGVIPDAEFFAILVYRLGFEGTWLLTGLGRERRKGFPKKLKTAGALNEEDLTSYEEARWFELKELQELRHEYMLKAAEIMETHAERYRRIRDEEQNATTQKALLHPSSLLPPASDPANPLG